MQTMEVRREVHPEARPATELVLAGNGPGELSGWIRPTAEAARAMALADGRTIRLTLALLPTQFAGGTELATVRGWNLFDRIIPPGECLRLAAGLGSLQTLPHAVLVHLGGELWLSSRLASRLGLPACAFSETVLIASRHRSFARIFVPTEGHAAELRARSVPEHKIVVTGDPRAAKPAQVRRHTLNLSAANAAASPTGRGGGSDMIAVLPGSRDRFFRTATPLFLEIATALAAVRPEVSVAVIVSPFVTAETLAAVRQSTVVRRSPVPVRWITGDPWPVLAGTRMALTLPGTATLELAAAGIPFAVVLPTDHIAVAAVEGPLEWIARVTGLHWTLKRFALARYRSQMKFVALPNQRAGRQIVPEWVGRWTPQDIAHRVHRLLDDPMGMTAMAAALAGLYESDAAAPSRIAGAAVALAGAR
jgi:hypothetical protein